MQHFLDIVVGGSAAEHQRRRGSFDSYAQMRAAAAPIGLSDAEATFLRHRDSFYLASVTEDGWPYIAVDALCVTDLHVCGRNR